jgi:hypothetical protein
MAVRNGIEQSVQWVRAAVVAFVVGHMLPAPVAAQNGAAQNGEVEKEVEKLAAQLALPGPDGKDAREQAIERLLMMPRGAAHEVLQASLVAAVDNEGLRLAICLSLQKHFLLAASAQLGGASGLERQRILAGYAAALASYWRENGSAREPIAEPVRAAARGALQRVPPRELDAAMRTVLATAGPEQQVDVLRCLADMQQTMFAATIAEHLDSADAAVRDGARAALQLLTCHEQPIRDRAEFAAWQATFGTWRYVDLVERAARLGARPLARAQEDLARLRVDAARDVVGALVARTPGIDWAAVQARVIVDDPKVMDACLELLRQALPAVAVDDVAPPRQAFCRALLERHRQVAADQLRRRALLVEVAAYLARPEETELATEIAKLLALQLDAAEPEGRLAALRGLRRFPSAELRARLVAMAKDLLVTEPVHRELLVAILATLTSRTAPRWTAPLPTDLDRTAWLDLLRAFCRSDETLELREPALAMAQMLDSSGRRVPEVFAVLTELVQAPELAPKLRLTAAIHLQGWRAETTFAEQWVLVEIALLRDPVSELRQQAAEALAGLTESVHERRSDWLGAAILELRERMLVENDAQVLRSFVECLQQIGREPAMPALAIGALRHVLHELGEPVPQESQFRLEPLLSALATIAADPHADRGQWLAACPLLFVHGRRQGLRLILQSHAAIELAKDVVSTETGLAERARLGLQFVIQAATLKPARESWTATAELQREARDVRTAFGALDNLTEAERPDEPRHRLLRLEVDLAAGKPQDVVNRATAWLAAAAPRGAMTDAHYDRIRLLAAEAQLALGRPDAARRLIDERTSEALTDAASLELEARIARALVPTDLGAAVELLGRVYRRTAVDDPAFRARLVEWTQLRLRFEPAQRAEILRDAEQHAALFLARDCPPELREAFQQLRTSR